MSVNMKTLSWCLFLPIVLVSCTRNRDETTTKGHLRVLVSESVSPAVIPEVAEFLRLYQERGADVSYTIVQSREANRRFVVDTARMIVTTLPLTSEEKSAVDKTSDQLLEIMLAYDGVVAVVHERNPLSELSLKEIQSILEGTTTTWNQLPGGGNSQERIRLVLEDSSDVAEYLSQRVLRGGSIQNVSTRSKDPLETIADVAKDRRALGFVPLSWIDSAKAKIKVLQLSADGALVDTTYKPPAESIGKFYEPHPAYLYLNYYPMKRAVYVYARTSSGDFATGFASFLASSAGQKMFLQRGLVPGTQRIVLKPSE